MAVVKQLRVGARVVLTRLTQDIRAVCPAVRREVVPPRKGPALTIPSERKVVAWFGQERCVGSADVLLWVVGWSRSRLSYTVDAITIIATGFPVSAARLHPAVGPRGPRDSHGVV